LPSKPKLFITFSNCNFKQQIEYTFKQLLLPLGIEYQFIVIDEIKKLKSHDLLISYGKNKPLTRADYQIHIYESNFFGRDYLTKASMPNLPLQRFGDLPIIYSGYGKIDDFVKRNSHLIETNIDIIASSFFMLTRYEEVIINKRDRFDRFPATASIAYKERFLARPIVNEYIELLWSWINSFNLGFERKKLWADKDFAVCLTHDVDRIRKFRIVPPFFTLRRALLHKKSLRRAGTMSCDYISVLIRLKDDPYQVAFGDIINLEKKYRARSCFYFMGDGDRYSIKDQFIIELIKKLKVERFEIGLHGSLNTYNSIENLRKEKEKVEEVVNNFIGGNRQHYLRWKTPETWRILEKAGLKYDTTLSFADYVGFRCGICYPYKPFDIFENRVLDIWEVPLIVMEGSIFGYQKLPPEKGLQKIKLLIDVVERYKGVFVTLWHNSSFYELENPNMWNVYRQMLDYINTKNALCGTIEEILAI